MEREIHLKIGENGRELKKKKVDIDSLKFPF